MSNKDMAGRITLRYFQFFLSLVLTFVSSTSTAVSISQAEVGATEKPTLKLQYAPISLIDPVYLIEVVSVPPTQIYVRSCTDPFPQR